ncbi:MAG: hypothetical protein U5J63_14405 [Fodinibius sp.]|nr:hypothetical protein [Fodinibius sp.]
MSSALKAASSSWMRSSNRLQPFGLAVTFGDYECQHAGMRFGFSEAGIDELLNLFEERKVLVKNIAETAKNFGDRLIVHALEELFFGVKVVVNHGFGNADLVGNLLEACALVGHE